ncbi:MAG: DNA repair protein RecN [Muribaculaceae bacterium]|nr:DNA repair protein RecN [Muribaculaceae bacterium]
MIKQLSICNYALIDRVELILNDGLTILTGETGAGKSVMMGAISLLMGERADSKVLANREGKAVIEGVFDSVATNLKDIFDSNDLDWNDGQIIVRREIAANGRSRAFINDTPVTLPLLTEVAGGLVDIHSQHSNRLLSKPEYQLSVIDSIADNADLLADYKKDFARFVGLRNKIKKLRDSMERSRENRELRAFQLEQLSKINPKKGELEEVEKDYDILSDADDLRSRINQAAYFISTADNSALMMIGDAGAGIDGIDFSLFEGPSDSSQPGIMERLRNVYIELKDIGDSLSRIASGIESDPVRLAKADERLKVLYEAVKRFKVADYDALVDLYASLKRENDGGSEKVEELNALESEARRLGDVLKDKAEKISISRASAAKRFEETLTANARPLGLKNLRFSVDISKGKLTPEGKDTVEFLCAFNKNQPLMPLSQTASGGEMARLTLCIKAITANKLKLPTVIFDEIDTGVSGDIADRMGSMMADIAEGMQVFAITHLPQVAVKGRSHLLVYKHDEGDRTVSHVKVLDSGERIKEIARMLSGKEINEAALSNAKALLEG